MQIADAIAIGSLFMAVCGVVFALGKQAESIQANSRTNKNVADRLDLHIQFTDRRLDELRIFTVRIDQRIANLERQVYGDQITEILRSGTSYSNSDDDTIPNL
jgi:hypothetical protein